MSLKEYKMCVSVRNLGEKGEAEPRVSEGRESDALNAPLHMFWILLRHISNVLQRERSVVIPPQFDK